MRSLIPILSLLSVLVAQACTSTPGSARSTAEAFVDAHYVVIDLSASLELCSGLARAKVEKEIDLTKDIEVGADTMRPRVNYSMEDVRETAEQGQFAFDLTIGAGTPDPFHKLVLVTVKRADGRWSVTNYAESDRPARR